VDVPEPVIGLGLWRMLSPEVLEVEKVTVPVNPLTGLTVIVELAWLPALMVMLVGFALRLKSTMLTVMVLV